MVVTKSGITMHIPTILPKSEISNNCGNRLTITCILHQIFRSDTVKLVAGDDIDSPLPLPLPHPLPSYWIKELTNK